MGHRSNAATTTYLLILSDDMLSVLQVSSEGGPSLAAAASGNETVRFREEVSTELGVDITHPHHLKKAALGNIGIEPLCERIHVGVANGMPPVWQLLVDVPSTGGDAAPGQLFIQTPSKAAFCQLLLRIVKSAGVTKTWRSAAAAAVSANTPLAMVDGVRPATVIPNASRGAPSPDAAPQPASKDIEVIALTNSQGRPRVSGVPTPPMNPSSFVGEKWDQKSELTRAAINKAAPPVTFTKTNLEKMFGWKHGSSKQLRPTVVFRYVSSMDGKQHEEVAQLLAPSRDDHDAEQAKQDGRPRVKVDGYPLPTDTLRKLYKQLGVVEGSRLRFVSQGWQGTQIVMHVSVLAPAGQALADVPGAATSAATGKRRRRTNNVYEEMYDNESQETDMAELSVDLRQPLAAPPGRVSQLHGLAAAAEAEATSTPLPADQIGQQIVGKSRTMWLDSKEVRQVLTSYEALGIKMTQQPFIAKPGDLFLCNHVPVVKIQDGHGWENRHNSDLKVDKEKVARVVYHTSKDGRLLRRVYELVTEIEPRLQLLHYHSLDGGEDTLRDKPISSHKRSPSGGGAGSAAAGVIHLGAAAHQQQEGEQAAPVAAAEAAAHTPGQWAAPAAALEASAQRPFQQAAPAAPAEAAAHGHGQAEEKDVAAAHHICRAQEEAAAASHRRRNADDEAATAAAADAAAQNCLLRAKDEAATAAAAEAAAQSCLLRAKEEAAAAARRRCQAEEEVAAAAAAEAAALFRQRIEQDAAAAAALEAAARRRQAEVNSHGSLSAAAALDAAVAPKQLRKELEGAEEQPHGHKRQAVKSEDLTPVVVKGGGKKRMEIYAELEQVLRKADVPRGDRLHFMKSCILDNTNDDAVDVHWYQLSTCHNAGEVADVREWVAMHL